MNPVEVERAVAGGAFEAAATVPAGHGSWFGNLLGAPGDDVSFRIRAAGPTGVSAWAGPVSVTVVDTFDVRVGRGCVEYGASDTLELRGRIVFADETRGFDPAQEALSILVADADGVPGAVVLPAGDLGWSARNGRLVWDSDRSAFRGFRGRIVLDARRETFQLRLVGLDLPDLTPPPPEQGRRAFVAVRIVLGDDQGMSFDLWTARGPRRSPGSVYVLR